MPEQEKVASGSASYFAAVGCLARLSIHAGSIPEKWEGRGRRPRGWANKVYAKSRRTTRNGSVAVVTVVVSQDSGCAEWVERRCR